MPGFAYGNAPTTILPIVFMAWIVAALSHASPRVPFSCLSHAMSATPLGYKFSLEAPTTGNVASLECSRCSRSHFAATALAIPVMILVAFYLSCIGDHGKTTKGNSRKIDEACTAECFNKVRNATLTLVGVSTRIMAILCKIGNVKSLIAADTCLGSHFGDSLSLEINKPIFHARCASRQTSAAA